MAPKSNTTEFVRLTKLGMTGLTPGDAFTASEMGGYQVAALLVTLAFALVGGIITGKSNSGLLEYQEGNSLITWVKVLDTHFFDPLGNQPLRRLFQFHTLSPVSGSR